jgi:hypothetical protein
MSTRIRATLVRFSPRSASIPWSDGKVTTNGWRRPEFHTDLGGPSWAQGAVGPRRSLAFQPGAARSDASSSPSRPVPTTEEELHDNYRSARRPSGRVDRRPAANEGELVPAAAAPDDLSHTGAERAVPQPQHLAHRTNCECPQSPDCDRGAPTASRVAAMHVQNERRVLRGLKTAGGSSRSILLGRAVALARHDPASVRGRRP